MRGLDASMDIYLLMIYMRRRSTSECVHHQSHGIIFVDYARVVGAMCGIICGSTDGAELVRGLGGGHDATSRK
jgi:hypothetical protein